MGIYTPSNVQDALNKISSWGYTSKFNGWMAQYSNTPNWYLDLSLETVTGQWNRLAITAPPDGLGLSIPVGLLQGQMIDPTQTAPNPDPLPLPFTPTPPPGTPVVAAAGLGGGLMVALGIAAVAVLAQRKRKSK